MNDLGIGAGGLPDHVRSGLEAFVATARSAFGDDLRSVVLYGSAAEGRLRATSDVNVIVVLRAFRPAAAEAMRGPVQMAGATFGLRAMLLLEGEIAAAAEAFAAKFADVRRRRCVLFGEDVFAGLEIPRAAELARIKQVLLNLILRLRAAYASEIHEDRLARALADAASPLRTSAAAWLELRGQQVPSPRDSLLRVAEEIAPGVYGPTLALVSEAREKAMLPHGTAGPALLALIDLAVALRERVVTDETGTQR